MADRTKLDSNFISLVLSVNGRVRPIDLHSIPEPERASALQTFYQANAASMPLHFDGDVLVTGVAGVPATPQPAVAAPPAEQPVSDYAPTPAPAPVSDQLPPPPAAPASFLDEPVGAADEASSDYFSIPPAGSSAEPPSADAPAAQFDLPAERISVLFWLLPVFLTWVGGIIAYFLVRKLNPKTAKAMLITGIVLAVVFALAGAAAVVALGLFTVQGP